MPLALSCRFLRKNRCKAINAQTASITVMGYAFTRALYAEVAPHAAPKSIRNHLERGSSQYESIIMPTAIEPKRVSKIYLLLNNLLRIRSIPRV